MYQQIFVRPKAGGIWIPCGDLAGDQRATALVNAWLSGFLTDMYRNQLDQGIARSVFNQEDSFVKGMFRYTFILVLYSILIVEESCICAMHGMCTIYNIHTHIARLCVYSIIRVIITYTYDSHTHIYNTGITENFKPFKKFTKDELQFGFKVDFPSS